MKIYINLTTQGKIITLNVDRDDTILKVRDLIQDKLGYLLPNLKLFFARHPIDQIHSVIDCCKINVEYRYVCFVRIEQGFTLDLELSYVVRANFRNKYRQEQNPHVPADIIETLQFGVTKDGLNLQGQCRNKLCKCYKKRVWMLKGYGQFNITIQICKSGCPVCQRRCGEVNFIKILNAKVRCKGRVRGEEQERKMFYETIKHKDQIEFTELNLQWEYLEMVVVKK